jgi:hypothetical protein
MYIGPAEIRTEHFRNTRQKRHCLSLVAWSLFMPIFLACLCCKFNSFYIMHVYFNILKWTKHIHSYMANLVPTLRPIAFTGDL